MGGKQWSGAVAQCGAERHQDVRPRRASPQDGGSPRVTGNPHGRGHARSCRGACVGRYAAAARLLHGFDDDRRLGAGHLAPRAPEQQLELRERRRREAAPTHHGRGWRRRVG
eukprot:1019096-Prymnesium_polylepis.1